MGTTLAFLTFIAAACRAQHCYIDPLTKQRICSLPAAEWQPASLSNPQSDFRNPQSPVASAHCRVRVGDGTVGSGTLVAKSDATAVVLTCSHLFDGSTSDTAIGNIVVEFPDSSRFGARLVERDRANDLAALLIRPPAAEPLAVDDNDVAASAVLTACGYGGDGRFRPVRGAVTGAAQAIGATSPSLRMGGAVRPGDSGGGVLDTAGRVVGVVWGCRDGETYLTCGRPLREFLHRVWSDRLRAGSSSSPVWSGIEDDPAPQPTIDWQAWRDDIDARLAALDARKQDRGDYLRVGDLNAYAKTSDVETTVAATSQQAVERVEQSSASRIDSLRAAVFDRIEERVAAAGPGLLGGLSYGKLAAGALGLSGPLALAVIAAGALVGARVKQRVASSSGTRPSTLDTQLRPIAVDSPPSPQQAVPESHYVPVQRDDFARAHQWAREQVARKYPGATEVLTTLESLIKQQLAAK